MKSDFILVENKEKGVCYVFSKAHFKSYRKATKEKTRTDYHWGKTGGKNHKFKKSVA